MLKYEPGVVLEYNDFSIFMFIILGKMSTQVVLVPAWIACHPDDIMDFT